MNWCCRRPAFSCGTTADTGTSSRTTPDIGVEPVTESVTASTPAKSPRMEVTTRSSSGNTAHGTTSPGNSE